VRFHDHPEPLHVDGCCRVNERGDRIIAGRVFDVIRRDLAEAGPVGR
jgi:hypothetical protein